MFRIHILIVYWLHYGDSTHLAAALLSDAFLYFDGLMANGFILKLGFHHDDVATWKRFHYHWPFVKGIHQWLVDFTHKGLAMHCFSFVVRLNELLNKQSSFKLFEMLWHLRDITVMIAKYNGVIYMKYQLTDSCVKLLHKDTKGALRCISEDHIFRADSRLVPSQWVTSLQSNAISHWLGTNLESALYIDKSGLGQVMAWCHLALRTIVLHKIWYLCLVSWWLGTV